MRAVRYSHDGGEPRLGRLDGDTVVDAGAAPPEGFVPSGEGWERIAAASGDTAPVAGVRLLHPTVPRSLIAIGLNYRDHAAESELEIPAVPVVFAKLPSALATHGPIGANVSKLLPSVNWRSGVSSWARRPETSCRQVMPPTALRASSAEAR